MKKNFYLRHVVAALIIVAVLVAIDQVTKGLARHYLADGPIVIWPGVFELSLVENTGMAFSMLAGKTWVFYILTPIVAIIAVVFYMKLPDKSRYYPLRICFEFLIAGAVGNYIDRIYKQSVTDFLYFSLINFPVFNVADIYVTLSMLALALMITFQYTNEELNAWIHKEK